MNNFTKEDFEKAIHDYELLLKPFAICCNPAQENELKEKLGNNYLYVSNLAVPEDKIFVIDRKKVEEDLLNDFEFVG